MTAALKINPKIHEKHFFLKKTPEKFGRSNKSTYLCIRI